MAKKVVKFFNPRIHTGWHKTQSLYYRRRLVQKAHGNDLLASGRAMQALANTSTDLPTVRESKKDASYFFRKHKERKNR